MKLALSVSVIQRGKSGVASYVFGLLKGMAKMEHPPEVHLFGLEEDESLFESWSRFCEWHPISEKFRPAVPNIFWHQTVFPRLLRKYSVDLVHIPSYRRIVAACPCPQVVTIHDMAPFHLRKKYDPLRMFYGRRVVPFLASRTDRVITVSRSTAKDVERFCNVQPAKISVIWNGIDEERFVPTPKLEPSVFETNFGKKAPYFIYLARLEHPAKNHVRLIEAFDTFMEACPNAPHHLVFGGADWHGADVIHERRAASKYSSRIHSLGFVDDNVLPRWYGQAEALVYPSLFEGFGLPPIEAMSCACPVVSSDRGSLGEILGAAALIVNPDRVDSMSSALEQVAAWEPKERAEMMARGLEHATPFSWSICAKRTIDVYEQVLST
ncbi:MAG: glycosyltransferase family 1 protein [Verrucomicrobiota bacterium]